jgi:Protein of unknown function (DUF3995)
LHIVAAFLAAVLFLLAALHLFWVVRGAAHAVAIPTRADGSRLINPGHTATILVALALAVAALIVLGRAELLNLGLPSRVVRAGSWGVAATFAARAVGDFRYAGLFKRLRSTPFARWDTLVFTPLCIVIAIAATWISII